MKIILTTILVFISFITLQAQNYIYKGDIQYESTRTWSLKSNDSFNKYYPEITVAKHKNGGYIMLSVNVPFSQIYIKGTLSVFLVDGTVIKCFDKGIRDNVNSRSIVLYNLTMEEIEKLKINRITRIRYSIYEGGVHGTNSYTADNILNKNSILYSFAHQTKSVNYYETDKTIKELFEKDGE